MASFLCGVGVSLFIGTLIGGAILMGSCKLFNVMVYKPVSRNGVPVPEMDQAMGIVFAAILVSIATVFGIRVAFGASLLEGTTNLNNITQPISIAVNYCVVTGLLAAMLPTSPGRAALVALLYSAIGLVCGAAFVLLVVLSIGPPEALV